MKILAYKGRSLISRAIQWQTRSQYSHIAIQLFSGSIIEAWHDGGVRRKPVSSLGHSPGTSIDEYRIDYEYDPDAVKIFLLRQLGKNYDYNAIFRFLSRRDEPADDKWFCSELALAAFPFLLKRVKPSHVTPGMLVMSPYLSLERSYQT